MTLLTSFSAVTARAGRAMAGAALGLALTAAVALPLLTPAPAQAQEAAPALWVVRDADSTIYLFGTVHVLKPDTAWASTRVDQAFDSAQQVWFEVANPDDTAAVMPLIQQYGLSMDRPLSSLLTAEEIAHLDVAARAIGASAAQLDPLRPWFAGLTLSMAPLTKAGYDPASGVELTLLARAKAAGKEVGALETLEQQVRMLAEMPEDMQLSFLRSTLQDYDRAAEMLDGMVAAWRTGDTEALDAVMVEEMARDYPELYRIMLTDRNADWAEQIEEHLKGSGVTFIAVGAGHLVGDSSVQTFLAQKGITATRVE